MQVEVFDPMPEDENTNTLNEADREVSGHTGIINVVRWCMRLGM